MKTDIGGYTYYSTRGEASSKRKSGEVTAHEGGLGWYNYNVEEYLKNPRKKIFGF